MLEEGTKAPNFNLEDKDGNMVSLSEFLGRKVVIYFYSKDNTAGCTRQAQGFRDEYKKFHEREAVVIGISKDTAHTHKKFAEKYELPFILLADPQHQALIAYDVWKEKNMYGKKVMGTVRATYIIDEEGIIDKVYKKANPDTNAAEACEYLGNKN